MLLSRCINRSALTVVGGASSVSSFGLETENECSSRRGALLALFEVVEYHSEYQTACSTPNCSTDQVAVKEYYFKDTPQQHPDNDYCWDENPGDLKRR